MFIFTSEIYSNEWWFYSEKVNASGQIF